MWFMYILGLGELLSLFGVFPYRAGLIGNNRLRGDVNWREFLYANIPFFVLLVVKSMFWVVTLAHWLTTGRKPSPWIATCTFKGQEVRDILRRDVAITAGLIEPDKG